MYSFELIFPHYLSKGLFSFEFWGFAGLLPCSILWPGRHRGTQRQCNNGGSGTWQFLTWLQVATFPSYIAESVSLALCASVSAQLCWDVGWLAFHWTTCGKVMWLAKYCTCSILGFVQGLKHTHLQMGDCFMDFFIMLHVLRLFQFWVIFTEWWK